MAVAPSRLWVCNFDGTLYRGGLARLTGGISNTDLFVQALLAAQDWGQCHRLLRGGWAIFGLHRRLRREMGAGRLSLADYDATCIGALRELLRREFRPAVLWRLGEALAGGLNPHALAALQRWLQPQDRLLILSKAFLPVLIPASVRVSASLNRPVAVVGNRFSEEGGILRAADKERELHRFLAGWRPDEAIAVGDTEEDVGMRDTLRGEGIPARLLAVAPKDARLASAADAVLPNWRQAGTRPFADR